MEDGGDRGAEGPRGFKRKKKKSAQQKFKKNFRPGSKRVENLDEAQVNYFRRVIDLEKANEFETPEDKAVFVRNIFKETEGREIEYSCIGFVSSLLERIIPFADERDMERFNRAFMADIRKMSVHRIASHVFEKLIQVSAQRVRTSTEDTSEETRASLLDFVLRSSRFFLNNLEEFVTDPYANRVARTCLVSLTGVRIPAAGNKPQGKKQEELPKEEQGEGGNVPEEFSGLAHEFAQAILGWPQLRDMSHSDLPSGFLQVLLLSIRSLNKKLTQKLVSRLLDECFDPGGNRAETFPEDEGEENDTKDEKKLDNQDSGLPKVFGTMASKRLLETALEVSSSKKFTQIYARLFINRLLALALDPNANLTLQKLLKLCREKVEFEAMYSELSGHLREILESGNTGVVLALAETCLRLETKQNDFIASIGGAFDCWEPESRQERMVETMLRMEAYSEGNDNTADRKMNVNLHGSLLIQTMLKFKKPIKVINSLLAMEANRLCEAMCDRRGSHIADAFASSESVGEKSRDRLVNKLKGQFVKLATDKYGSRVFDVLWSRAKLPQRTKMAAELSVKESQVESSQFGKIIASKIFLAEFRHRADAWSAKMKEETEGKKEADRTRKLFEDIVGGIVTNKEED